MLLPNIKFYIADYETGLLDIKFICYQCGAEFDYEPPHYQIRFPCPGGIIKKTPEVRFWCSDRCYEEEQ